MRFAQRVRIEFVQIYANLTKTLYRAKLLKFSIDKPQGKWYTMGIEFKKRGTFYYETLFDTYIGTDYGAVCYVWHGCL